MVAVWRTSTLESAEKTGKDFPGAGRTAEMAKPTLEERKCGM